MIQEYDFQPEQRLLKMTQADFCSNPGRPQHLEVAHSAPQGVGADGRTFQTVEALRRALHNRVRVYTELCGWIGMAFARRFSRLETGPHRRRLTTLNLE